MYQIEVDPHTHSVVSLHAYSTVEECARHAAERGLRGIAVTDHCSHTLSQRANSIEAISNQKVLPDEMYGVRVWKGVEIDIVDFDGTLAFERTRERAWKSRRPAAIWACSSPSAATRTPRSRSARLKAPCACWKASIFRRS